MVKFTTTIAALTALFAPSGVEGQFFSDKVVNRFTPAANSTKTVESDEPKKIHSTSNLFLKEELRKHP